MPRNYKTTQRRRLLQQPLKTTSSTSSSSNGQSYDPIASSDALLESITEGINSNDDSKTNSSAGSLAKHEMKKAGEFVNGDVTSSEKEEKKGEETTISEEKNGKGVVNGEVGLPLFQSTATFPSSSDENLVSQQQQQQDVDRIMNLERNYDDISTDVKNDLKLYNDNALAKEKENNVKSPQDIPQNTKHQEVEEEKENDTVISEDHTNTPMIYTYKNNDDSDSVSQITSSIAGSSYYYQPPITRGSSGRVGTVIGGTASIGESYAADSLDEIVFLSNSTPSVVRNASGMKNRGGGQAIGGRYTNRFNSVSYDPKKSAAAQANKPIPSTSSLYSDSQSIYQTNMSSAPLGTHYETPSEHRSSSIQSTINSTLSKIKLPPGAKTKLTILYHRLEHYFLPPPLRSSKKKDDCDDGEEEEEVDYFERLMSPDFLLSGNSVAPSTIGGSTYGGGSTFGGGSTMYTNDTAYNRRNEKRKRLQDRKYWFTIFRLVWLFMLCTSFLVGLRLASRHGIRGQQGMGGSNGGGGKVSGLGFGANIGNVELGNLNYEWDNNMGMIRPKNGLVDGGQGGGGGGGGVNNNINRNYDIPIGAPPLKPILQSAGSDRLEKQYTEQGGDPLNPLLSSTSKLRPNIAENYDNVRHIGLPLSPIFDNLADVTDFPSAGIKQKKVILDGVGSMIGGPNGDIPFFWHIPRTGGATMNDVLGSCLRLSLASDAGGREGHDHDEELKILKFTQHFSYVNVDTSSIEGIERCKRLGLVTSGLADAVVTSLFQEAASMFTPTNRGRMFALFRHPIERAVSLFHYVQDTQWRRSANFQEDLAELTIQEYFKGGMAENNWMTRFLTGELTKGELDDDDLDLAKEILRRKCLVGLLKEKGESFSRVERYFGWHLKTDADRDCYEKKIEWAWPLKHRHDDVEEGTELWDIIMRQNVYDVQLYEYAELLFQEQSQFFQ